MIQDFGMEVAKSLNAMGARINPKRYEVWFMHLSGTKPELTQKIQDAQTSGLNIADPVLDRLAEEYSETEKKNKEYLKKVDVLEEASGEVNKLNNRYTEELQKYQGNVQGTVQSISRGELSVDQFEELAIGTLRDAEEMSRQTSLMEEGLASAIAEIKVLRQSLAQAKKEAVTDPLTGLYNRRYFFQELSDTLDRSRSQNFDVCLVVIDIDHFKRINDTFGHQTGDQIIQYISSQISANANSEEVVARVGGEEFVLLLPGSCQSDGVERAEKIRQIIASRSLKKRQTGEQIGTITVSMGLAEATINMSSEELFGAADEALYQAKKEGRNCVRIYENCSK